MQTQGPQVAYCPLKLGKQLTRAGKVLIKLEDSKLSKEATQLIEKYGGRVVEKGVGGVTNAGKILGNFGIPEYYTYTFRGKSVLVSPNAMKHLTELATHGAGNPNYLKLLGQTHQKALHSAINDVLSRGKITYRKMYYSGGNEIILPDQRLP